MYGAKVKYNRIGKVRIVEQERIIQGGKSSEVDVGRSVGREGGGMGGVWVVTMSDDDAREQRAR